MSNFRLILSRLGIVVLTASFCFFGCEKRTNKKSDELMEAVVNYAAELRQMAPEAVLDKYHIRRLEEVNEKTIVFEFFSKELVGDKAVESMMTMRGGYPDYFHFKFNRETGQIISTYADEQ